MSRCNLDLEYTFLKVHGDASMDDHPIKITIFAFYYKTGKTGDDYVYKETYKIPYQEAEFTELKSAISYIR